MGEKIENIYDKQKVGEYYRTVGEIEEEEKKNAADKLFEQSLPEDCSGLTALDLGCGNGRYSEELIKRGAERVVALDYSEEMVEQAKKRKEEKDLKNLEVIQADMSDVPVEKESFDLAISRFSLMYSPDLAKTLGEVSMSLKSGAEFIVETNQAIAKPGGEQRLEELKGKQVPLILKIIGNKIQLKNVVWTPADFVAGFEQNGLEVISEKRFPPNDEHQSLELDAEAMGTDDDQKIDFEYVVFKLRKKKRTS